MTTYYLGTTKSGAILARSSTRPDFAYAACGTDYKPGEVIRAGQSSWSGTADAARANFTNGYRHGGDCEIVKVRRVTGAEFRAAIKGS